METNTELKIFVVDDDPFSLTMYEHHLRNLGYTNVTAFENGTACLNNLTKQPDLIFLDHQMEILNGVDVLKKIKRFNPNTFVVFISAQDDVQTAVNSLKYGAFDYIIKGDNDTVKMEKVLEKLHEVMDMMKKKKKGFLKGIFS